MLLFASVAAASDVGSAKATADRLNRSSLVLYAEPNKTLKTAFAKPQAAAASGDQLDSQFRLGR
jgi:hypothetical protein